MFFSRKISPSISRSITMRKESSPREGTSGCNLKNFQFRGWIYFHEGITVARINAYTSQPSPFPANQQLTYERMMTPHFCTVDSNSTRHGWNRCADLKKKHRGQRGRGATMECKSLGKRPGIVKMIRGPAAILILSRKRKNSPQGVCLRRFSNRGCGFCM